jgi:hypothetical protein
MDTFCKMSLSIGASCGGLVDAIDLIIEMPMNAATYSLPAKTD